MKNASILCFFLLSIIGCSQIETEKSKIDNILNKVQSGEIAWLKENFLKNSEFGRHRSSKADWGKNGEYEVQEHLYKTYSEIMSLAANEKNSREVREAAFYVLGTEPLLVDIHPVTNEKYIGDGFLIAWTRNTSMPEIDRIKIKQKLSRSYGYKYDLEDNEFVKNEMCRVVIEDKHNSLEYMIYLMSIAQFDVGMVRCEKLPNRFLSSFEYEVAREGASCPMSLRRLAGEAWGEQVAVRNQMWLARIEAIDAKELKLTKKTKEAMKSFNNLPNLSSVKSMINLLDPINKWAEGTCSTKKK